LVLLSAFGAFFVSSTAYAATPIVESAKITGPNTVTVVYSEAVNTTLNDYGNFSGSLAGMSLSGISGSGTNVITLTFSGGTFSPSATGGMNINNTVTAISDGSLLGGGPYTVTDGQAPLLSSFSVTSSLTNGTFARAGDTLTVTFSADEPVYGSPTVTIDNNTVTASGNGQGPYTASYTLSSSDTPDNVPVTVNMTDIAGNVGYGSFVIGGGTGPRIVSITSDANTAGSLIPGNTVNFVLTLANPAPGAYVAGSYDGVPLTWTTNNGGATYVATYTVASGNASTYSPLQITGVTVRDSSGNVSAPASGTDILKTINAQSFSISETTPVPSVVTTNTPQYAFYSSQDGTIAYGGDCSSANLTAGTGYNYITFNPLPNGTHSNCTITVTDQGGYASNTLTLSPFTVDLSGNPVTQISTLPTGCTSAVGYSTTTGLSCATNGTSTTSSTYPAGCSSNYGYSVTTGQSCATTPSYPAGCTSNVGYSSTTGESCATETSASGATVAATPSSYSYKFYNPLSYGSTGADVTALQQRLASEGIYSGPITGFFGSLTEAAVKQYQGLHGLSQLGNVGPATRADLNAGL